MSEFQELPYLIDACLRIFNGVPVKEPEALSVGQTHIVNPKHGYVAHPAINHYPAVINRINLMFLKKDLVNETFYNDWVDVISKSRLELLIDQVCHYITVAYKDLEIIDQKQIYVPRCAVDLPEIEEDEIPFVYIDALSFERVIEKVKVLSHNNVALGEQTLNDLTTIIFYLYTNGHVDKDFIGTVDSFELKVRLYDELLIVPEDPTDYLRFLVYLATGKTLLVNSQRTYRAIKMSQNADKIISKLSLAPSSLPEIFHRYKKIFLGLKHLTGEHNLFNKISKQAKKMHKPLPMNFLNSVTQELLNDTLDIRGLSDKIDSEKNIWRTLKLLQAIRVRMNAAEQEGSTSYPYFIRTGKTFVDKEFSWPSELSSVTQSGYCLLLSKVAERIAYKVEGKTFYKPEWFHPAIPLSEKQFVGNIPYGTCIESEKTNTVGIHWDNIKNGNRIERVDLDLSCTLIGGVKIGWNSDFYTEDRSMCYSGDITSPHPTNGASELIRFGTNRPAIAYVNPYTTHTREVPFQLYFGNCENVDIREGFMLNPNHITMSLQQTIGTQEKILGCILPDPKENSAKFYFFGLDNGERRVSETNDDLLAALSFKAMNYVPLEEVLVLAGGNVVTEQPTDTEDYVDLSPEGLEKTTILELFV